MGRYLLVYLVVIQVFITVGTGQKVSKIAPKDGGSNGAVRITIYGEGFAANRFNFGENNSLLGNRVIFASETRVIPCDIHDNGCTEIQIECNTRYMPPDTYHVHVYVDDVRIPNENLCGGPPGYSSCTYQSRGIFKSPWLYKITPPASLPGELITVSGKMYTDMYKVYNKTGSTKKPGMIIRSYLGGQHCELLMDNMDDAYGIDLDLIVKSGKYMETGVITCKPQGTYVGNQNFSFIVDYNYGRSMPDPSITRITSENKITTFQTYAEVTGVSPSSGSTMGGTLITITGRHFDETDAPVKVKVDKADCEVNHIQDDEIVCTVGSQTSKNESTFPGNRGAIKNIWNTTGPGFMWIGLEDMPEIQTNFTPMMFEHLQTLGWGIPGQAYEYDYHVSETLGFFIPPSDNDYMFHVMSDDVAKLWFADGQDISNMTLIAWNKKPQDVYEEPNQMSERMSLKRGEPYFLQVHHKQVTGNAHLRVAVHMYNTPYTSQHSGSVKNEIQVVESKSKVTPEIQTLNVSGWQMQSAVGEVQRIRVTSPSIPDAQIRFGMYGVYTDAVGGRVTARSLRSELNQLPIDIYVDVTRAIIPAGSEFTITFKYKNRGDWPDFTVIRDPSSPVPITYSVTELRKGIPDMAHLLLSYDGVPSLPIYGPSVSVEDLTASMNAIFSVRCPTSLTNPIGAKLHQSYEIPTPEQAEDGERVQDQEPFCGSTSLKNPTSLFKYKKGRLPMNAFRYRVFCFAYFGTIEDKLGIEYAMGKVKRKNKFTVEWPTSDGWVYHCVDLPIVIRSIYSRDNSGSLNRIYVIKKGKDDLFVDEIYIGTNKPSTDTDFSTYRRLPPKNWICDEVTVEQTGIQAFDIAIHTHDCAHDLTMLRVEHASGSGFGNEMTYEGGTWPSGVQVQLTRVQTASPPVHGTFSITYGGRTTADISADVEAEDFLNILETLPGMGTLSMLQAGTCSSYQWTFEWLTVPGDRPLVQVNSENILGYHARMIVTTEQDGGVFFETIPGDMLRTFETDPQVLVVVNHIPSICNGSCGYNWTETDTPIISAVTPSQGSAGISLTISGTGFDSATLSNNELTIGSASCPVTGLFGSALVCTLGSTIAGKYDVILRVDNTGLAGYDDDSPVKFTYMFTVTGLAPIAGGLGGGTLITIQGGSFSDSVRVTISGSHCSITTVNPDNITCITPSGGSTGAVDVVLTESSTIITSPVAFTYDVSITPIITEISDTFILVADKTTRLTLTGSGFGVGLITVKLNDQSVTVVQYNDTDLVIDLTPQPVGDYSLYILVSGDRGYAVFNNLTLPVITYHMVVTSVWPVYGSGFGGTRMTIAGEGFGSDLTAVQVSIGKSECEPTHVEAAEVLCTMLPSEKTHVVSNQGVHPVHGLGYVWTPQVITIEVADTIHWEWSTPVLLETIGYRVEQTETPTAKEASGFKSAAKTYNGTFEWRFTSPGVYYYWSGGPVDDEHIIMRGTVYVDKKPSYAAPVIVTINGHESPYRPINITMANITQCVTEYSNTTEAPTTIGEFDFYSNATNTTGFNMYYNATNTTGFNYTEMYTNLTTPLPENVTLSIFNATTDTNVTDAYIFNMTGLNYTVPFINLTTVAPENATYVMVNNSTDASTATIENSTSMFNNSTDASTATPENSTSMFNNSTDASTATTETVTSSVFSNNTQANNANVTENSTFVTGIPIMGIGHNYTTLADNSNITTTTNPDDTTTTNFSQHTSMIPGSNTTVDPDYTTMLLPNDTTTESADTTTEFVDVTTNINLTTHMSDNVTMLFVDSSSNLSYNTTYVTYNATAMPIGNTSTTYFAETTAATDNVTALNQTWNTTAMPSGYLNATDFGETTAATDNVTMIAVNRTTESYWNVTTSNTTIVFNTNVTAMEYNQTIGGYWNSTDMFVNVTSSNVTWNESMWYTYGINILNTTDYINTTINITDEVTTQPLTTEPLTTEPLTTEPLTTEPLTTEPLTTEPLTTEPMTTEMITTVEPTIPWYERPGTPCYDSMPSVDDHLVVGYSFWECTSPTITHISPRRGDVNTPINITGTHFGTEACRKHVLVGEYSCMVTESSDTTILCYLDTEDTMPVGVPYEITMLVETMGVALMTIDDFLERTFALLPHVTKVSPPIGSTSGGTELTVEGVGFMDGFTSVLIAGVLCVASGTTYRSLTCITDKAWSAWEIGTYIEVNVLVDTEWLPAECITECVYGYLMAITPQVAVITPRLIENTHEILNITGEGFTINQSNVTVFVGETECTLLSLTDTEIFCDAGEPAVGEQFLVVHVNNKGNANIEIDYSKIQVTISYNRTVNLSLTVQPDLGSIGGGTPITIHGVGFSNSTNVTIGGEPCYIQSFTNSSIQCRTPAGVEGQAELLVVWNDIDNNAVPYTYSANHTVQMSALSSPVGSPGDFLTIATVDNIPNNTMVTITLGVTDCDISTINGTEITCTVGEQAVGEKSVMMYIHDWGYAVGDFTYTCRFAVYSVTTNTGSYGGGDLILISGVGFESALVITLCDNVCHISGTISYTQVMCVTPPHTGDSIDYCDVVASLGAETTQLTDGYAYILTKTPVIYSVNPTSGLSNGGSSLTITGTGFSSATNMSVSIGGTDCPIDSIFNETKIICTTKEHRPSIPTDVVVFIESMGISTVDPAGSASYHYMDLWSSDWTWDGQGHPVDGDDVIIDSNMTVILDTDTPMMRLLHIRGGMLLFKDMDIELQAEIILISDGGHLQVGTESAPFQHKATIILHGHVKSEGLPIFGAKCLAVREGTLDLHGSPVSTMWTHLSSTAYAGDVIITLMDPVFQWSSGDQIVIATTGDRHSHYQNEKRTISSVSGDGRTLTLDTALVYDHLGVELNLTASRTLQARAEVGLLSHNILFRGAANLQWTDDITMCEEDYNIGEYVTRTCHQARRGEDLGYDQFGAHIMMSAPRIDEELVIGRISHVEFTYVGQTYRSSRYAINFHMNGNMPSSYVRGCSVHRSFNRAVVIHGTHQVTVERNVVYDIKGGAFFLEDAIETLNTFQYNLAVFVMPSTRLENEDLTPAAFWVSNPDNRFLYNGVAGGSHFGFWYKMPVNPVGPSFTATICPGRIPLLEFRDNSVHSVGWYGMWLNPLYQPSIDSSCKGVEAVTAHFNGFTAWNNAKGVEWLDVGGTQFLNFVLVQNEACALHMRLIKSLLVDYTDAGPMIANSLFVANVDGLSSNITREAIILPYGRGLIIANTTFKGFTNYNDGMVHTCFSVTDIPGKTESNNGGYTYFTNNLVFDDSPNVIAWRWEHEAVFYDIDGSLCGFPHCKVIPYNPSLPPNCVPAPPSLTVNPNVPVSICDGSTWFHRFSFNKLSPKPKGNTDVTFTGSYGSTVAVARTLRVTHPAGYMVLMHNNDNYMMSWAFKELINMSYTGHYYGFKGNDYVIVDHNFTEVPDSFTVIKGEDRNATYPLVNGTTGDWYYEIYDRIFSYIINAFYEDMVFADPELLRNHGEVTLDVHKCYFRGCIEPPDPNTVAPVDTRPDYFEYWDVKRAWKDAEPGWGGNYGGSDYGPPKQGDNVKILLDTWIVVRTPTPEIKQIWIYGALEFDMSHTNSAGETINYDFTFSATHIIIAGGRLVVGWPKIPFPGQMQFVMRGDSNTPEINLPEGPKLGAKAIGVFGGLDLHGSPRAVSWTRLAETADVGATSLTLEEPSNWLIGDEIVFAPTGFDLEETEIRTITSVSNNGTNLSWSYPLEHQHLVSVENIGRNMTYTMAAEVGLLTRNIKVIGEPYPDQLSEAFGARMLVGTYQDDRLYIGYARLSNVEFQRTGQEGYTDWYDPRFSLAYLETGEVTNIKPSYIRSCTFHHGFAPAIGVFGTNKLDMLDNVIHHTVGSSMIVTGMDARLMHNLIIQVVHAGAFNGRNELRPEWEGGIQTLGSTNLLLFDNVVAGSHRALYRIDGEACDKAGTGAEMWSANVGHSALSGIVIFPDEGIIPCTLLANFTIYRTFDYGIYTQTEASFKVVNYLSMDNQLGLFPMVVKPSAQQHKYSNKYYEVQDSVFVGRTSVYDCLDNLTGVNIDLSQTGRSWRTDSGGKIAMSWPTFSSDDNGAPNKIFHGIMAYQALRGILRVTDVTFVGFNTQAVNTTCAGQRDVIIATNPYNDDVQHPVVMERITLEDTNNESLAFIHHARIEMINPADCVDMDCDGLRKVLLKDLDGGFLGRPGVLFSQSEWEWDGDPLRGLGSHRIPVEFLEDDRGNPIDIAELIKGRGIYRDDSCMFAEVYQAYVCYNLGYEMLHLESTDYDSETRRVSPVSAFSKGYIDLVNGPRDHGWCYDDTCRKRLSTFPFILASGRMYEIYFTGMTPQNTRYHWLNTNATTAVLLATWYPQYWRVNIYVDGKFIKPTNGYYTDKNQLALRAPDYVGQYVPDVHTDPTGTNYFDRAAQVLYVLVRGPSTIDIRTDNVVLVTFNVPYRVMEETFRQKIMQDFAELFDIPIEKVLISETMTNDTMTFTVEVVNPPDAELSEETVVITAGGDIGDIGGSTSGDTGGSTGDSGGSTGDSGGSTGDSGGSTGDSGGSTGDSGGSTGDSSGSTGDSGSSSGGTGTDSSGGMAAPDLDALSQEKMLEISKSVVTSFQLGVFDDILNTTIETMAVDKPPPVANTSEYNDFVNQETPVIEPIIMVVPKKIVVVTKPEPADEFELFTVQPQIRTMDAFGSIVEQVGTSDNLWTAVVSLGMLDGSHPRAVLRGPKHSVFQDGWANFTDLSITHSGTYNIVFNIANTSVPATRYAVNVTQRPLMGMVMSQPYEIHGDGSFGAVIQVVHADTKETVEDLQWKDHVWECQAFLYRANSYYSVNNATLDGVTSEVVAIQADIGSFHNLSIEAFQNIPLAIFRNLTLVKQNRYIISFQCETDLGDYNFTFDSEPIMVYSPVWEGIVQEIQNTVNGTSKAHVDMWFKQEEIVGDGDDDDDDEDDEVVLTTDDEPFIATAVHNHLWNRYPAVSFTDVNVSIGDSDIEFYISGLDDNVTSALYDLWDYLKEPMMVLYGEIPLRIRLRMNVNGTDFYGHDGPPMILKSAWVPAGIIAGSVVGICVLCCCLALPKKRRSEEEEQRPPQSSESADDQTTTDDKNTSRI